MACSTGSNSAICYEPFSATIYYAVVSDEHTSRKALRIKSLQGSSILIAFVQQIHAFRAAISRMLYQAVTGQRIVAFRQLYMQSMPLTKSTMDMDYFEMGANNNLWCLHMGLPFVMAGTPWRDKRRIVIIVVIRFRINRVVEGHLKIIHSHGICHVIKTSHRHTQHHWSCTFWSKLQTNLFFLSNHPVFYAKCV